MSEYAQGVEEPRPVGNASLLMQSDLLSMLEERIQHLIERHRGAQRGIEDLAAQLAERDRRIARLEGVRDQVTARLDRLIEKVAALEAGAS